MIIDYVIVAGDDGGTIPIDVRDEPYVVQLPVPTSAFKITIKDAYKSADLNSITILRSSSSIKIDGEANDDIINKPGQAVTYISDGSNWFRISSNASLARAIGLFGGGQILAGSNVATIDSLYITTLTSKFAFGNLSVAKSYLAGCGNTTRSIFAGGDDGAATNVIEYTTPSITGALFDFGDLTAARSALAGCSNSTRGVFFGGSVSGTVMDYITIASTGNATSFGTMTSRDYPGAVASPTRGVWAGSPSAGGAGIMEYITIATTGNSTSFGNMSVARYGTGGVASATRGLFGGGYIPAVNASATIDYITIATTGNAASFGTLTNIRQEPGAASSSIRGVWAGGGANGSRTDTIEYVTIASLSNASDFGSLIATARQGVAGCSNAHGGL